MFQTLWLRHSLLVKVAPRGHPAPLPHGYKLWPGISPVERIFKIWQILPVLLVEFQFIMYTPLTSTISYVCWSSLQNSHWFFTPSGVWKSREDNRLSSISGWKMDSIKGVDMRPGLFLAALRDKTSLRAWCWRGNKTNFQINKFLLFWLVIYQGEVITIMLFLQTGYTLWWKCM